MANATQPIIFFGSPAFAVAALSALLESGRRVSLVVTQPDRPAGRGRQLEPPPVKTFAVSRGLPILQPKKMKDPVLHDRLRTENAPVHIVAAYGRLIPKPMLEIPKFMLNVHASVLPRWRGASPIQRAVQYGDSETGVSIMRLVEELDAGDVMHVRRVAIPPEVSSGELEGELARIGAEALLEALDLIDAGKERFVPQPREGVTLAPPIEVAEARIDWTRPAMETHNQVRAFNPWPGAYTSDGAQRVKIHRTRVTEEVASAEPGTLRDEHGRLLVASGDRWLEVLELQREGKARQPAKIFLSGYRLSVGKRWA